MTQVDLTLAGQHLKALPSGALWWPEKAVLCVSDLHLGKSERIARRTGGILPPYETRETLARLAKDIDQTAAGQVICLGDSFDDLQAASELPPEEKNWINQMQAGRSWIWIEGNHDPGPIGMGGSHLAEFTLGQVTFRHIAQSDANGEVSGHYHPKVSLRLGGRTITRPAFLYDSHRLILPAYGTYTGGLDSRSDVFSPLLRPGACAVLTGKSAVAVPMPR